MGRLSTHKPVEAADVISPRLVDLAVEKQREWEAAEGASEAAAGETENAVGGYEEADVEQEEGDGEEYLVAGEEDYEEGYEEGENEQTNGDEAGGYKEGGAEDGEGEGGYEEQSADGEFAAAEREAAVDAEEMEAGAGGRYQQGGQSDEGSEGGGYVEGAEGEYEEGGDYQESGENQENGEYQEEGAEDNQANDLQEEGADRYGEGEAEGYEGEDGEHQEGGEFQEEGGEYEEGEGEYEEGEGQYEQGGENEEEGGEYEGEGAEQYQGQSGESYAQEGGQELQQGEGEQNEEEAEGEYQEEEGIEYQVQEGAEGEYEEGREEYLEGGEEYDGEGEEQQLEGEQEEYYEEGGEGGEAEEAHAGLGKSNEGGELSEEGGNAAGPGEEVDGLAEGQEEAGYEEEEAYAEGGEELLVEEGGEAGEYAEDEDAYVEEGGQLLGEEGEFAEGKEGFAEEGEGEEKMEEYAEEGGNEEEMEEHEEQQMEGDVEAEEYAEGEAQVFPEEGAKGIQLRAEQEENLRGEEEHLEEAEELEAEAAEEFQAEYAFEETEEEVQNEEAGGDSDGDQIVEAEGEEDAEYEVVEGEGQELEGGAEYAVDKGGEEETQEFSFHVGGQERPEDDIAVVELSEDQQYEEKEYSAGDESARGILGGTVRIEEYDGTNEGSSEQQGGVIVYEVTEADGQEETEGLEEGYEEQEGLVESEAGVEEVEGDAYEAEQTAAYKQTAARGLEERLFSKGYALQTGSSVRELTEMYSKSKVTMVRSQLLSVEEATGRTAISRSLVDTDDESDPVRERQSVTQSMEVRMSPRESINTPLGLSPKNSVEGPGVNDLPMPEEELSARLLAKSARVSSTGLSSTGRKRSGTDGSKAVGGSRRSSSAGADKLFAGTPMLSANLVQKQLPRAWEEPDRGLGLTENGANGTERTFGQAQRNQRVEELERRLQEVTEREQSAAQDRVATVALLQQTEDELASTAAHLAELARERARFQQEQYGEMWPVVYSKVKHLAETARAWLHETGPRKTAQHLETIEAELFSLLAVMHSGQPDSSTLKEIVQSERLGAALDTEKTRAEKLAQRAAAAEKQLKMAVRKNRVLAMENHLAIQKLHSLGVVSIPLQPLAADMSKIDSYEPQIPGYDFSPISTPGDSPRFARDAPERMGLRQKTGRNSPRPTFSPLSSQKAPQPPPGLRKLRTHTSLTSPKAQSDVGSPRKRHSNPGDNNSKPATQTVALSNGAIFKQGENVAPDLPPRARNSASTEQGHVSRSDWLAIAKQAALLKGVVPERTHTGLLRGTLARDATPVEIDGAVKALKAQFDSAGVPWPLHKVGDRAYRLGAKKLALKLTAGRLMVRIGGGAENILDTIEKSALSAAA